jgi:hypothetical protein
MMNQKLIVTISLIGLIFLQKIYSQNITSTCTALKQTTDFTTDLKPSLKKLKKMVDKVPKEEMLEYALYLNNFLKLQLASTSENYPYTRNAISTDIMTLSKEYVLPLALEGNFKAISFLSGNGYLSSSKALSLISKSSAKNSVAKFAQYQLNFKSADNVKYTNKYILSEDTLLKNYFTDFNRDDLIKLRDTINNKIKEVDKIKKVFYVSSYDYNNSVDVRNSALKKLPAPINDITFCISFDLAAIKGTGELSIVPKAFDGTTIKYDAVDFLEILRGSIDLILRDENPISLAQILFDYVNGRMGNESEWRFNYINPKDQYFVNDKKWGPIIFKLLSGALPCDTTTSSIKQKSYYLNRAAQLGETNAYSNLAVLYQTLFYKTNSTKYNDSCIYYLEKSILFNDPEALTLKGIKVFNGEGYIQNKEEGVKLILKAKSLGGSSAKELLETLPQQYNEFETFEGYNFGQRVEFKFPWDFKVLCSNNCGKTTYPKKIIFGRTYDKSYGLPQPDGAIFYLDNLGNPIIHFSENDFRKTFVIAEMGFKRWKHVMCSNTCQLAHENRNNKDWAEIENKRKQLSNEKIKCVACDKVMKKSDMLSFSDCPCYTKTGSSMNLNFSRNGDLYGDYDPRACSSECQINFCKTKCSSNGYTTKY